MASLLACFSRIQGLLCLDALSDSRKLPGEPSRRDDYEPFPRHSNRVNIVSGHELRDRATTSSVEPVTSSSPAITLSDVTISPMLNAEPVLRGVNLKIYRSTINMIVGPTGSGKSTLLKAIIGESEIVEGVIAVSFPKMGYCDQSCWLRNVSIQQSIIGPLKLDPEWYEKVLSSCLLDEDLSHISGGDQSLVGSDGVLLSGGQKQRVVSPSPAKMIKEYRTLVNHIPGSCSSYICSRPDACARRRLQRSGSGD
jgi:ABC-type multidrug transport system fused ATPase/permease subunit